jgi:hypothetical protein
MLVAVVAVALSLQPVLARAVVVAVNRVFSEVAHR